jgi:2-polyprenyl-3-methyl-5-hydroxy-6-metoxy-1,4-benzoquinol methylase
MDGRSTLSAAAGGTERDTARSRCLACGGALSVAPLAGLRRCVQCGFVTANEELDAASLAALYGKDYFHGSEYLDYVQERESLRLNFRSRMQTLEALGSELRGKSVLDVGCAYGFFLELAREYGMVGRGVDIAGDGVRYAREQLHVDAIEGDYLELRTEPVDLVVMWDTVEHLSRPDLFIEKAAGDLRPGGLLAVTTGDIGSINARLRGRRWRMIHPPTHLHYFSRATLGHLLSRHGLQVVHVSHPGVTRRLRSILYILLAQRLKAPRMYDVLKRLLPDTPLTLNLFDIMFIVARKPAAPVA